MSSRSRCVVVCCEPAIPDPAVCIHDVVLFVLARLLPPISHLSISLNPTLAAETYPSVTCIYAAIIPTPCMSAHCHSIFVSLHACRSKCSCATPWLVAPCMCLHLGA